MDVGGAGQQAAVGKVNARKLATTKASAKEDEAVALAVGGEDGGRPAASAAAHAPAEKEEARCTYGPQAAHCQKDTAGASRSMAKPLVEEEAPSAAWAPEVFGVEVTGKMFCVTQGGAAETGSPCKKATVRLEEEKVRQERA